MKTNKQILMKHFCNNACYNSRDKSNTRCRKTISCSKIKEHSALIDKILDDVPCDTNIKSGSIKYWHGYHDHIDEVSAYVKKEKGV